MEDSGIIIGDTLKGLKFSKDFEFQSDSLELDEIIFQFSCGIDLSICVLKDTDELEVFYAKRSQDLNITNLFGLPELPDSLIDKKLTEMWICRNSQGYQDQIMLAFGETTHPTISLISEGSVIKVFKLRQI